MTVDSATRRQLAPAGRLRATINLGNPILAAKDTATGRLHGVSVDLAVNLAESLDLELDLIEFDAAGKAVAALTDGYADIGFFAVDPGRARGVSFTAPYVLIEGCYLVREESPIRSIDEVDRRSHRVVVGKGSAYDLFLTRELREAHLYRAPTSPAVVDTFIHQRADVAAGVRQQLEADMRRLPGFRMLDGRFMVIPQAMAVPGDRPQAVLSLLASHVEEMKTSGFVARALERHHIEGASVAPPA